MHFISYISSSHCSSPFLYEFERGLWNWLYLHMGGRGWMCVVNSVNPAGKLPIEFCHWTTFKFNFCFCDLKKVTHTHTHPYTWPKTVTCMPTPRSNDIKCACSVPQLHLPPPPPPDWPVISESGVITWVNVQVERWLAMFLGRLLPRSYRL